MKKLISIVSGAAICLFVSCNSKESGGGMTDKAKKNVENAKAITAMFEKGDFSKAGDYIAPDAVDHAGPRGDVKGLDSLKAEFNYFSSTMSDAKNEEVKTIADDDYVFQWIKQSWTAKVDDPMMNLKAGQRGTMESIEVTKHNADGKITDHWGFASISDMMKNMPQPTMSQMNNMSDTSKMKTNK